MIGEVERHRRHRRPTGGSHPIDVAGAVTARASVAGGLYAFTVAGAVANASGQKDAPSPTAGGNAPADDDPLDGISLPPLFGQDPPQPGSPGEEGRHQRRHRRRRRRQQRHRHHPGLAGRLHASRADAVDVKAPTTIDIVAATGGLAFSKTDAGGNAVALAGAFSYNGIDATTDALDPRRRHHAARRRLRGVRRRDRRAALLASPPTRRRHLDAGRRRRRRRGRRRHQRLTAAARSRSRWPARSRSTRSPATPGPGCSTRDVDFDAPAAARRGHRASDRSGVAWRTDDSDIFAIAGALSLAIAEGGKGKATAVAFGVAIAVNTITTDTEALVEDSDARSGPTTRPAG